MAHNLAQFQGREAMFYTGETPWHKLGVKLPNVATAAEAIAAAGLDWAVTKEPVYLANGKPVPRQYATVRGDTGEVLGSVGEVYRPFQNREAFSFFDAVVQEKLAMYHTAGALGNGSRIWIAAKLPGTVKVTDKDVIEKYLIITHSHDGTSKIEMMFTPTRIVCQNTLNVAIGDGSHRQRAKHTNTIGLKVASFRDGLGIVTQKFGEFEATAQALTKISMTKDRLSQFLQDTGLLPKTPAEIEKMSTRARNILDEVLTLFERGRGNDLPGVKGTAWAAFNAVTEYTDHERGTRTMGEGMEDSARVSSMLFGSGADMKQKAWEAATALIVA